MFKKKITTISFEGSEIRALVLQGNKIAAWQSQSLAPETMNQGFVHNPKAAADVIRTLLRELKGSRKNVISAVPGSRSVHRIMRIPVIPEKMLEETIERKARQEFAIPIEESDLSWRIISRQDNQLTLYVLAVPSNLINQQVQALKDAGVKPRLMDIKPLALGRLANRETSIIVNLESHSMGVIITTNHVPILIRTIPLDSGDLTGEAKTDLLSQELARTTKYFNESHKKNRLPEDTPVFISGALFSSSGIASRLEDAESLIERLQDRTPYPLKLPVSDLELPEKFPLLKYAVNLGLAVKNTR